MGRLLKTSFLNYLRDESASTAVEYGLITALISVAVIVGVQLVGTNLNIIFMKIAYQLQAINSGLSVHSSISLSGR